MLSFKMSCGDSKANIPALRTLPVISVGLAPGGKSFYPTEIFRTVAGINALLSEETRGEALEELSKLRHVPNLAIVLWHSVGCVSALLLELISFYEVIYPRRLTAVHGSRLCNALVLLQCVAQHHETRHAFLTAQIPIYLYPFLYTVNTEQPYDYLRLTCLGVLSAMVKTKDHIVISYLLTTELVPLLLQVMDCGSELCKSVALYILHKILIDDAGLQYICLTHERFSYFAAILGKLAVTVYQKQCDEYEDTEENTNMIMGKDQTRRIVKHLTKHVILCYHRLSDNCRASEALRGCFPCEIKDTAFLNKLSNDNETKCWLLELLHILERPVLFQCPIPRSVLVQQEMMKKCAAMQAEAAQQAFHQSRSSMLCRKMTTEKELGEQRSAEKAVKAILDMLEQIDAQEKDLAESTQQGQRVLQREKFPMRRFTTIEEVLQHQQALNQPQYFLQEHQNQHEAGAQAEQSGQITGALLNEFVPDMICLPNAEQAQYLGDEPHIEYLLPEDSVEVPTIQGMGKTKQKNRCRQASRKVLKKQGRARNAWREQDQYIPGLSNKPTERHSGKR